jgi:N-acetylmuramate 1-kinase
MSDYVARLERFLKISGESAGFEQLTQDASTREYFRIGWRESSAIACVYPEPFIAAEQSYLDVTALFRAADLPVAKIHDFNEELGVIVQEDLGDTILRPILAASDEQKKETLIDEAIGLIARIQAATELAFQTGSIAGKLRFDTEKLLWELNFFKEHYFTTFLKKPLEKTLDDTLTDEFTELAVELEGRASVLCHRDFHAANLMIDPHGELRIIDHQDARIGSASYDLVSLLLDRITESPTPEWLASKRHLLLSKRISLGLEALDPIDYEYEFRLQTVQRCLKAAGTFSFQSANRGKTYFIPFIKPMFRIVLRTLEDLGRFPQLRETLTQEADRE